MTTDPPAAATADRASRRRRPHPAATARTVAAGAAAFGTCALVTVFGLTASVDAPAPVVSAPGVPQAPSVAYGSSGSSGSFVVPDARPSSPTVGQAGRSAPATRSSSS